VKSPSRNQRDEATRIALSENVARFVLLSWSWTNFANILPALWRDEREQDGQDGYMSILLRGYLIRSLSLSLSLFFICFVFVSRNNNSARGFRFAR